MLLPRFSPAQTKINIAVLDLESKAGIPKSEASSITDELRSQIIKIDVFNMIERSKMNDIMAEQGLQSSDMCNSEECFVEMGQIMGVEKLIVGTIGKVGGIFILSIRMIDVKTGKIALDISDKYKGTIEDVLLILVPRVVEKLAEEMDVKDHQVAKGTISIKSNVEGAEVLVDGKPLGQVPLVNAEITTGSHAILVIKNGYQTGKATVLIGQKKEHKELDIALKPKTVVEAIWRSSIAPGWGQLYNGQKVKGVTVSSLQVATVAFYLFSLFSFNSAVTAYDEAQYNYSNTPSSYDPALRKELDEKFNEAEKKKPLVVAGGVAALSVWGLNILDAAILGPKYNAVPGPQALKTSSQRIRAGNYYWYCDISQVAAGVEIIF